MKILVSAYACHPRVGSESTVGWNWTRQIAERHECHVITRENNVAAVEAAARELGLTNLVVHGFDLPYWMRFWKRGGRGALAYFYLWQLALVPVARRLDRRHDFDVAHHLTFTSSWIPAGLAFLGKPFVWGPVGRHPRVPDRFLGRWDLAARSAEWLKSGVRNCLTRFDPLVRRTVRSADRILSLGSAGERALPAEHRERTVSMLAIGTDACALEPGRWHRRGSFRVLFAGRLVDLKGVGLVIDSFAELVRSRPAAELVVVGDGNRRERMHERARHLGIAHRVRFHGHLSSEETLAQMRSADVFLFPSFEGAGMVVVEAMARGCPVVCLDFGGPGEIVDETGGLTVPLEATPGETALALADALRQLHDDPELCARLGRGAVEWVERHALWSRKGERLEAIYRGACRARSERSAA